MLVHGIAQVYSEVYGPKDDQAGSYPSQDSSSEESGDVKECEVESSKF